MVWETLTTQARTLTSHLWNPHKAEVEMKSLRTSTSQAEIKRDPLSRKALTPEVSLWPLHVCYGMFVLHPMHVRCTYAIVVKIHITLNATV